MKRRQVFPATQKVEMGQERGDTKKKRI